MKIALTAAELDRYFSADKEQLIKLLGRKGVAEEAIEFYIDMCQTVQSSSLVEIIETGEKSADSEFNPASYHFSGLIGRSGRKFNRLENLTAPQTDFLLAKVKQLWDEDEAEEQAEAERFAALSPEEQAAEQAALLAQLRGPGFLEVVIHPKKVPK